MEDWLLFGLLAAVSYSLAALAAKLSLAGESGLQVTQAGLLTGFGVFLAFVVFTMYSGLPSFSKASPKTIAFGLGVGLLWAVGQILVYVALMKGADISRMAPIYNLNTLFVVVFGIFLLGELPDRAQALRVGLGAILITAGAVLVSV
ncbi:MAG: EamA family transporter [Candidatus Altiarchaeota archaeon]|nr:EamA family transporter [Candidatus Altiarchaeota archaeon]